MLQSGDHRRVVSRRFAVSLPIRSHGLLLREWRLEAEDIDAVQQTSAEPTETRAGPPPSHPGSDARATAQRWICEGYELESRDAGARLAVCSWDGGLVLGGLDLTVLETDQFQVGFWLLAAERGCGVESRALAACLDWLSGERPRGRLWVAIGPDDHPGLAAVRSCGFSRPGLHSLPQGISEAGGQLFQRKLSSLS